MQILNSVLFFGFIALALSSWALFALADSDDGPRGDKLRRNAVGILVIAFAVVAPVGITISIMAGR